MPRYELKKGDKYFFFPNNEFDPKILVKENAFTVEEIEQLDDSGIIYSNGGFLDRSDWDKVWVLRDDGIVQQLKQPLED